MSSNYTREAPSVDPPSSSERSVLRIDDAARDSLGLSRAEATEFCSQFKDDWRRQREAEQLLLRYQALSYPEWYLPLNEWEANDTLPENATLICDIAAALKHSRSTVQLSDIKVRKIQIESQEGDGLAPTVLSGNGERYQDNHVIAAMTLFAQEMSREEERGSTIEVHYHANRHGIAPTEIVSFGSSHLPDRPGLVAVYGTLDQLASIDYAGYGYPCNMDRTWFIDPTSQPVFVTRQAALDTEDDGFMIISGDGNDEIVDVAEPTIDDHAHQLLDRIFRAYIQDKPGGWSNDPRLTLLVTGSGDEKEEMITALTKAMQQVWPEPRTFPDDSHPKYFPILSVQSA